MMVGVRRIEMLRRVESVVAAVSPGMWKDASGVDAVWSGVEADSDTDTDTGSSYQRVVVALLLFPSLLYYF